MSVNLVSTTSISISSYLQAARNAIAPFLEAVGATIGVYVKPGSSEDIARAAKHLYSVTRLQDKPSAQVEFAKAVLLRVTTNGDQKPFYPSYRFATLIFQCKILNMQMQHVLNIRGADQLDKIAFMSEHEWKAAVKQAALVLGQETYLSQRLDVAAIVERIYQISSVCTQDSKRPLAEQKAFCQKIMQCSQEKKDSEVEEKLQDLIQGKLTPKAGVIYRGMQLLATAVVIGCAYDGLFYYTAGNTPLLDYSKECFATIQENPQYKQAADYLSLAAGKLQGYYQQSNYYERIRTVVQAWIMPLCPTSVNA